MDPERKHSPSPARTIRFLSHKRRSIYEAARRRGEARARPGHERVAADTIALRHLADASHRVVFLFTMSNSPGFFGPGAFLPPGSSPYLFSPSSLPTPPSEGDWRSAQRRPALIGVAQ